MPFDPDAVLARVGPHSAATGRAGAERMRLALDAIFRPFAKEAFTPADAAKVADIVRDASCWLRGRGPTLYVTERYLADLDDPARERRLPPDERGNRFEHVVPIKFSLPADAFLHDPLAAIAPPVDPALAGLPWLNRVARALLTPICYVSRHEDVRLDRLRHPDWRHPFARYCDLHDPVLLRDAPGCPIVVHDTLTGRRIDPLATFDWSAHLALMAASAQFAPLLTVVRTFFEGLADRDPALSAAMARRPGGAAWPQPGDMADRAGRHGAADRAAMRARLAGLIADGPRAGAGAVFELPLNRERLTLTVRHPRDHDRLVLRINIGPDHGKRELYFNARDMHGDGARHIERVAAIANAADAAFRLVPQRDNGARRIGYDIRYAADPRRRHADHLARAFETLIPAIVRAHAEIGNAA